MNFGFSEEQELLRNELRKLLDETCPMTEVRRIAASPEGYDAALFAKLGELGFLGLAIPEAYGGAGLQWLDLTIVLEETGRGLFPSPLVSNTLAAAALLECGSEAQRQALLPELAAGTRVATPALEDVGPAPSSGLAPCTGRPVGDGFVLDGVVRQVTDPETASHFIVAFASEDEPEALTLALVDARAPGVSAQAFPMIDETKRMGDVRLSGVAVSRDAVLGSPGAARPDVKRLQDLGAVAVAAEMLGSATAALDLTVQYAKDRIQFGSPIGRFQGVKHPLAEMFLQVESARSLLYYAAWAADAKPAELPRAASRAKAYASEAFARAGIDGIQLHGTIGYTEAYDIQLYLKRSKWARPMFGDADHHYERLLALRGL